MFPWWETYGSGKGNINAKKTPNLIIYFTLYPIK